MGNRKLISFINFLKECLDFKFNIDNFDHRLMLQKYVYLAGFLGLGHNYFYNLYIRGPYSSGLANDYYNLDNVDLELSEASLTDLNKREFMNLIKDKDVLWLEAASTILSLYNAYKRNYRGRELKKMILTKTKSLKPYINDEIMSNAYREIEERFMVNS